MIQKIQLVFNAQQAHKFLLRKSNAAERIAKLRGLKDVIKKNERRIYHALHRDLRKSTFETSVTELFFIYAELDHAIKNLAEWMAPKRIGKTLSSPFSKNRIYYEPKGICLIIAPWNYPLQLTMSPLISAIAAGNCVIVKPSELSPATSGVVHKIINDAFDEHEVACFEGNANLSTTLLQLPFDHIFFTGSTAVGKVVMEAAAKNLTGLTLELGGKSPTIIDVTANLEKAAEKIAWGKLTNSGQTCIAPDYVFVHADQIVKFVELYKAAANRMYFRTADKIDASVYGKIINPRHYQRLKNILNEAVYQGAKLNWGGTFDDENQTVYPIVLTEVPNSTKIMEEEIFGPILPIVAYKTLKEVVDQINERSKPLALYIFSSNQANIKYMLKNTSAGGTCVNDVLVHISNPKLPFGGISGSGMGSSHGVFGFRTFSHERAVVFQRRFEFNRLVYPPYAGKKWVLNLLKRIM